LAEYQKAPQVTRDRMYLETMQQIYANATKVMVDSKQGSNLLYLPLDKLLQQSVVTPPTDPSSLPSTQPAPTALPSTPTTEARTRDASRSRDRDGR